MSSEFLAHPGLVDKTTYLSQQVARAAEKYGSNAVFVASFTRASAQELVQRDLPIPRAQIGTLHAHCYRALGAPEIAESHIKEWNQWIRSSIPQYRMTPSEGISLDEKIEFENVTDGDAIFSDLQIARARMAPLVSERLIGFQVHWEAFKREVNLYDFTDLIEIATRDLEYAPGSPQVGVFDEAQDFTKLELSLVRKWAETMEFVLIAGDDDQAIFTFKGSTPDAFLDPPIPDTQKRILGESFRVPRRVQAMATMWVQQLTRRENKPYRARDAEGEVRRLPAQWREPQPIIEDALKYLAAGKSVMFLGSCSYMLDELRDELKRQAIPFCNPYRRRRGDWNPLAGGRGTSSGERLLMFLRPPNSGLWTRSELAKWGAVLRAEGVFQRNMKKVVQNMEGAQVIGYDELQTLLEPVALDAALRGDTDWFVEHLMTERKQPMEFPLAVYKKRGIAALRERPKAIIGTIHSTKGGEADVVYLFPDISPRANTGWQIGGEDRDAVIRMFYVGMTRAKESLIVTQAAGFGAPLPAEDFALQRGERQTLKIS